MSLEEKLLILNSQNINNIKRIPKIGIGKAIKIHKYISENGSLKDITHLLKIPGISFNTINSIIKLPIRPYKKRTTIQLQNEQKQKQELEKICRLKYGLIVKEDWGSGSKNKKFNSNADITFKIEDIDKLRKNIPKLNSKFKNGYPIKLSLKTIGGNFTIANTGISLRSALFKYMKLTDKEINYLNNSINKIKKFKNEIIQKNGTESLWKDYDNDKIKVKQIYQDLIFELFSNPKNIENLYNWLNERESDLKYIGTIMLIPEKKTVPEVCKIEKKGNDSIIIGYYKLRVKCESKEVVKSWKINIEFNQ